MHAPPSLSITVATSKPSYLPGESIDVYGNLTWIGSPVEGLVALQVDYPSNQTVVLRTLQTGGAFETGSIEIVEMWTSDVYGNPKTSFEPGTSVYFNVYVNNTGAEKTMVLLTVNAYDVYNFTLGLSGSLFKWVSPGAPEGGRFELEIPTWASSGNATAYAIALTTKPKYGGIAHCPEQPVTFAITGSTQGSSTPSAQGQSITANYNLTFKLSTEETLGTYTVYASSGYQQEQAMDSTTFTLAAAENQPPLASFTISPDPPHYVGDTLTFNASASYDPDGTIASYDWDFGDGTSGSGEIVTHAYSTAGTYKVNLTVTDDGVPTQTASATADVTVSPALVHDIAITSVTAPAEATVGDTVSISVDISNPGDYDETFDLKVTYDTSLIETRSVFLAAKGSGTESISWDTTGVTPATYTITAEAILVEDEDLTNNVATAAILLKSKIGWIEGYVTDVDVGAALVGATVTADGNSATTDSTGYYKIDVPAPATYTVTAEMTGYYSDTKTNIFVDLEATVKVDFALELIVGWIDGYVTDSETGAALVGATVTANGVSATTNAAGYYKIELVPGTYDVTASMSGYESKTEYDVVVSEGLTTTLDFALVEIPEWGWIAGHVTDVDTGAALVGATVTADGVSVTTDATGYYEIKIAPGTYDVTAEMTGYYGTTEYDVVVTKDLTTAIDFALTRMIHDVAVASLTAPAEAYQGDIVTVSVDLSNLGDYDETFELKISINGTVFSSKTVTLTKGSSVTESATLDTSTVSPGTYTIRAEAVLATDNDPTDNWKEASITVLSPPKHDVAVISVAAPADATVGDIVTISVDTANPGDYEETFDIEVRYDTIIIGSKSVTLLSKGSTTISFSWSTTSVAPASYTIEVEVILITDEDLTNNKATASIIVNPKLVMGYPVASFIETPESPMVNETVIFASNSTDMDGYIASWLWDFGDDSYDSGQIVTHKYATAGNYSVTLTVIDNDGLSDTVTHVKTVLAAPVASFIKSPESPMVGETVIFASTSTDPDGYIVSWLWDFGDGSYGNGSAVTHAYATAGNYSVALTVTDNQGLQDSCSKVITVQEASALPPPGVPLYVLAAAVIAIVFLVALIAYLVGARKPKPTK